MFKLLKGFLNIFSVAANFRKEKGEYERSGYILKMLSLLLHTGFIALVGVCAYGAYLCITSIDFSTANAIFVTNILYIVGAIFCISIGFSLAFKTFFSCLQKTIIAFNSARKPRQPKKPSDHQTISANASSLGEDILIDRKGANADELSKMQQNEQVVKYDDTYANQAPKTSKGFDIFYGTISLILTLALPAGIAALFTVIL